VTKRDAISIERQVRTTLHNAIDSSVGNLATDSKKKRQGNDRPDKDGVIAGQARE
jgi:hypothetical protein